MKVKEVMTRDVQGVSREARITDVAERMRTLDVGSLPVCDAGRVVGMITDRDITLRVTAEGRDPGQTTAADIMTRDVLTCAEDQDLAEVEDLMQDQQIRRVPVVDRSKILVGLVTLAKIARAEEESVSGKVLRGISQPEKPSGRGARTSSRSRR